MAQKTAKALAVLAEVYGHSVSEAAADFLVEILNKYPEHTVLTALKKCAAECKRFPTPADIIERIDDGHPGVEMAWGMLPRNETQTVVWTSLIRDAWGVTAPLIDEDLVAARMAFKEAYSKLLSDARAAQQEPIWEVSMGHDKNLREIAIKNATAKGWLPNDAAVALLGHQPSDSTPNEMLPGKEPKPQKDNTFTDIKTTISNIMAGIESAEIKSQVDK